MVYVRSRYAKTALGYAAALSMAAGGIALRAAPPAVSAAPATNAVVVVANTNEIYNYYLRKFMPVDKTTDEAITNNINAYLGKSVKDWKIVFKKPTWYKESSVMEVVMEPADNGSNKFPVLKSVFIENGKLLKDNAGKVITYMIN